MRRFLALALLSASCTPDIPRDDAPPKRVVALFDPAAATPVVPLPNDLVIDPVTLLLAIPDAPDATAAQREFNAYLRTLDGFPTVAPLTVSFSDPLAADSVKPEAVRLLDVTDPAAVVEVSGLTLAYSAPLRQVTITAPLQRERTYLVAVLGGSEPKGLKGAGGEEVIGSAAFALVRAHQSLGTCELLGSSDCQSATSLLDTAEKAIALERARRALQTGLNFLEAAGLARERLASAWSFTTTHQSLATFDPADQTAPFPNDLLISAGKVNLPDDPKDDALSRQLKLQFNQLDGFSTTASLITETSDTLGAADARLDSDSLNPAQFRIINLDNPTESVPFTVSCRACGKAGVSPGTEPDQVALTPTRPLRSHERYAVLWLRGAKSLEGKPINANTNFALVRGKAPLFLNDKSTLDGVDDVTAALAEGLRLRLAPALVAADTAGIDRTQLVLAWSFTTQTTAPALVTLAGKPKDWALPTGITGGPANLLTLDFGLLATLGTFVGQDLSSAVRWAKEGEFTSASALDPTGTEVDFATMAATSTDGAFTDALLSLPRLETRRFLLLVPRVPKFADGRIPVVFFHHGLGETRRDAAVIANTLARAGYATLAIDAPFHGLRSFCQSNADCRAPTTCTDHRCPDLLLNPNDGYAVRQVPPFGDDPLGTPVISGNQFVSPSNLFASRDHFRQQIIDYAQLVRVLNDTTAGIGAIDVDDAATPAITEKLEPANPRYIGQSLGGILGTLITAAIPEITAATLNVPGASMTDVILNSTSFMSYRAPLDAYLNSRGWPPGSQGSLRFFDLARWVLDPADPQNFGRHLIAEPLGSSPKKRVFVSWVKDDEVVPNLTTELLLRSIELNGTDTALFKVKQYPSGGHAFLLNVGSVASAALAIQAQQDAVDWVTAP